MSTEPLVEDRDYYWENGFMVFTAFFLKARGYCCGSNCRHCPYPKIDRSVEDLIHASYQLSSEPD